MRSFDDLAGAHHGKRICVMGGGPSLAADLELVQADVWISVNGHGTALRRPDYALAMDPVHKGAGLRMLEYVRQRTDAPLISPHPWADIVLDCYPLSPRKMLSGVVASWAASVMGGEPVILAGFDCYGQLDAALDQHREYAEIMPGPVVAVSGPLLGLLGGLSAPVR